MEQRGGPRPQPRPSRGLSEGFEVFARNRSDVTTVREIVIKIEKRFGKAQRVSMDVSVPFEE